MFSISTLSISFCLLTSALAMYVGEEKVETKPQLQWQQYDEDGNPTTKTSGVTIDSNWRWFHDDSLSNCYSDTAWSCDCDTECDLCYIEGESDYSGVYGVSTSGSELTLVYETVSTYSTNYGSRLYLMNPDDSTKYQMFSLLGNEFTFDVDVSALPCGTNGAVYFVEMEEDGGTGPGAEYGAGYCDSQCPRDLKLVNGEAHCESWADGIGQTGVCCNEIDVWEANSRANAVALHPCEEHGIVTCQGDSGCGGTYSNPDNRYDGPCDPDGCDYNPYRLGDTTFYGNDNTFDINTDTSFTIVTQFLQEDGIMTEMKRIFIQNDVVIYQNSITVNDNSYNSVTESYCADKKIAFDDLDQFEEFGGMDTMGQMPMTLALSLWTDSYYGMLWLDSAMEGDGTAGDERGPCIADESADLIANSGGDIKVIYSNIKFGPIGSTFDANATDDGSTSTATTVGSYTADTTVDAEDYGSSCTCS